MSVELDNLKALIDDLDDKDDPNVKYEYSPVDPCGIIGVKIFFNRTIFLTKRDVDEQVPEHI